MSKVTILHLSDIHFKRDENQTFRDDVQDKMIEAIQQHLDKHHRELDFVAVTGDIAFSGKGKEYDEAKAFFEALEPVLPGGIRFLLVPGNHDVDRKKVSKFFSLHQIVKENETDAFLKDHGEISTHINPKFKNFREFADTLNPGLYKEEEDYFWVKDFKKKDVSFLGLNSCWACEGDNDRNNITLGYPQVMKALKESKISNCIALMHHPPTYWLNEDDFSRYSGEIFHHCQLILHGHTHADNALVFKSPSDSCICLGANASYTKDRDGFIGFQFIEVKFQGRGVGVRVWPFRLEKRGRVRFVSDFQRWEGQEGPYFELKSYEDEPGKEKKSTPRLPREIPQEYKDWVREFHSTMDIDLLAKKGEAITVALPEVYIPIETRNPFYKQKQKKKRKENIEDLILGPIKEGEVEQESKDPPNIDIEALVSRKKRILLKGGAGMGKTTLIKHLAYTITANTCHSSLKGYLPVMIFLKDLWLIYKEMKKEERIVVFDELMALYLEKSKCKLTWPTVCAYLENQKVLFLLDGLDEVPVNLRPDLVDIIAHFQFQHKENRFLITGRPHGIAGRAIKRFGNDLHEIEPLDDGKIKDFIKKWFRAISGQARGLAEVTAEGMISDIRQHEHISAFTQNPLLLTAVCILYQDGKRIPEQRADLYNRIIENLVHRRFHDPAHQGKENEILEFLMALAFDTQVKNRKTIDSGDALDILKQNTPQTHNELDTHYKRRIMQLFNEIEPGCGLFDCLSSGEIQFTHLTFQEFLAAKYMVYMDIHWRQFLDKEWWEETLLLYTGFMSIDRKRNSNEIIKTILTKKAREVKKEKERRRLQFLGARALCDFHASKRDDKVVSLARGQLLQLMESDAALAERFQAGKLAGRLGDTRLDDDNMVMVPAGEFIRGSKDDENSSPVKHIYLDAFFIGKYPVTNQEFKQFVAAKGYDKEESWTPQGWQWRCEENIIEPRYWHDRKWNGPNFPVVGISWYEAVAYANWLSKVTKKDYRLPTEAEWEKAARGTDGNIYPWGNKFDKSLCNSWESGLQQTSPVGIFPKGKSPYSCFDMAGNVWEWCADWYDEEYYKKSPAKNPKGPTDGSWRVDRGGGWILDAQYCASAFRNACHPGSRDGSLGVRLARSLK
jgi:formylglycine-generating enzyme required for sulfatase activity/predicted MPP superfamily phosphohydrolase/energy-coupling factor transporter ATP-binding protein EcfA2